MVVPIGPPSLASIPTLPIKIALKFYHSCGWIQIALPSPSTKRKEKTSSLSRETMERLGRLFIWTTLSRGRYFRGIPNIGLLELNTWNDRRAEVTVPLSYCIPRMDSIGPTGRLHQPSSARALRRAVFSTTELSQICTVKNQRTWPYQQMVRCSLPGQLAKVASASLDLN